MSSYDLLIAVAPLLANRGHTLSSSPQIETYHLARFQVSRPYCLVCMISFTAEK